MSSRIATTSIYNRAHENVATARERHVATSEKASTQKEVVRPSSNPAAYMNATSIKDEMSIRNSIAQNAKYATNVLNATETIFEQVNENIQRTYELAISMSGDSGQGPQTRLGALSEVKSLFEGMIQTLNYKFGPRTLLAGYRSNGPAFSAEGEFVGDKGKIEVEIDRGLKIPLTLSGERAVLGQGLPNGVNIIQSYRNLMQGLEANDVDLIQSSLPMLQQGIEQVNLMRSEVAGHSKAVDSALSRHAVNDIEMQTAVSEIEDVDAVKVFSDLARDQTILQAAIATSKKILDNESVGLMFQ